MRTGQMKQGEGQLLMVPVETDIKCQWRVDQVNKRVNLSVATNNDRVVRAVVIFADQLFPGESLFVCPKEQKEELVIPLCPAKDVANDLFLKVFVGVRNGSLFYLKEQNYKMPRFSMYVPVPNTASIPPIDGKVTFTIDQKLSKVPAHRPARCSAVRWPGCRVITA
jgi:Bardet-Biedl syndrome 2 protein